MAEENKFNDNEMKHLEFIQNAISRLGANSFQMKGWAIAIFAAALALFAATGGVEASYLFMAIIPALLLWFLDAYYLQQERKFRGIYDDVAQASGENKQDVQLFAMPLNLYADGKYSYLNVFWSKTVWPLYLVMIAGGAIGGVIMHNIR
ncbi:MAG: hypothetical protein LBT62_01955 [Deltaproteobacteria bacterium]|jgi:hypothetical protein|nr:hypothetical protein [Deltaproteobacteria bacterium]